MDAYHALAASYDRLTNDVDYAAVVAFYGEILAAEGLRPRTAVDLACGTGSVSALLAARGLSVTGVDMSQEMLTMAWDKTCGMENRPFFVCQKLQDLHLPRGVDLAVCALDSLDYITDPADCAKAIRQVYRALNPGGIFIFDVNTPKSSVPWMVRCFWTRTTMSTAYGAGSLTGKAISVPTAWICSSAVEKRGCGALKSTGSMPTPVRPSPRF